MVSSEMLRRVALVRTGVSEDPSASFIRVTRIGELGTTQAATSNQGISLQRPSVASCSLCHNHDKNCRGLPLLSKEFLHRRHTHFGQIFYGE
jgi:hypothetical protein